MCMRIYVSILVFVGSCTGVKHHVNINFAINPIKIATSWTRA